MNCLQLNDFASCSSLLPPATHRIKLIYRLWMCTSADGHYECEEAEGTDLGADYVDITLMLVQFICSPADQTHAITPPR